MQDRAGRGLPALEQATWSDRRLGERRRRGSHQAFTLFNTHTPQLYADIDRTKAELLQVPIDRVFETLSVYMGSAYINDFNLLGRTYQVTAQADNPFRLTLRDVENLKTRNNHGDMVPIGSVATFRDTTGPFRVPRYNLYPAAEVQLALARGFSTGQAIAAMEKIAQERLPQGFGFEWTEIALQEKLAGNTAIIAFGLAVVFVFLLLAALYESWLLPLAVVLIVPMCILAAMLGVNAARAGPQHPGRDRPRGAGRAGGEERDPDRGVRHAGRGAGHEPVRCGGGRGAHPAAADPDDVAGVHPGRRAAGDCTGAGAEMRQSLGTAVFAGMLGVTLFGLVFTPVFYVLTRRIELRLGATREAPEAHAAAD